MTGPAKSGDAMSGPRVLTVVLNWRTAAMTLRAVETALAAMEGIAGAITIVDNDSGDGSFETLTAEVAARGWTRVRVIASGRNGGFGAGNNVGIRAGLPDGTRPDYVYILDHLERHPGTGFAGSHVHGPEGDPHRTAFRFPTPAGEFEMQVRFGPVTRAFRDRVIAPALPTVTGRVDWLAGASLMMRTAVLDRIGLFDETFFLYFEETDLCLRAARAGFPTDYVVESRVAHIGSASTGMKTWTRIPGYWLDSRFHYYLKNHGRAGLVAATLACLAGGALWRLRLLVQRRDRGDPPGFLRDLARHHARRLFAPAPILREQTT
jgi:N-acetylglucosaminyl-diphospho-decaprenol L-rhamnosyltransferase